MKENNDGELAAGMDPDGASDIPLQLSLVKNTVALNSLGQKGCLIVTVE